MSYFNPFYPLYFSDSDTLSQAYHAILAERGDEAYWYRRTKAEFEPWEESYSINGMTKNNFRKICHETGFSIVYDYPLALFETGRLRRRFPMLGLSVPVFHFLGRFPLLEEVFNHRIVMILRK